MTKKKTEKRKPAPPLMKMRLNICGLLRESDLRATATHSHTLHTHAQAEKKKIKKIGFGCPRSFDEREVHALPTGSGDTFTEGGKKNQKKKTSILASNRQEMSRRSLGRHSRQAAQNEGAHPSWREQEPTARTRPFLFAAAAAGMGGVGGGGGAWLMKLRYEVQLVRRRPAGGNDASAMQRNTHTTSNVGPSWLLANRGEKNNK